MTNSVNILSIFTLCGFILAACHSSEGSTQSHLASPFARSTTLPEMVSPPSQTPHLATLVFQQPAAGIRNGSEGELVVITIYPNIPDQRCAIIAPDQILKVVKSRRETLQVSIANMETTIEPGSEHTFNVPLGQYLAPGMHLIEVNPCCGASLWLK
jgi:hypothetical protein